MAFGSRRAQIVWPEHFSEGCRQGTLAQGSKKNDGPEPKEQSRPKDRRRFT